MPLELDWVRETRVNRSAVERRAATLPKRRTVKKEWQLGWLLGDGGVSIGPPHRA
jgi:deoxyribose-phosphate aldolase